MKAGSCINLHSVAMIYWQYVSAGLELGGAWFDWGGLNDMAEITVIFIIIIKEYGN